MKKIPYILIIILLLNFLSCDNPIGAGSVFQVFLVDKDFNTTLERLRVKDKLGIYITVLEDKRIKLNIFYYYEKSAIPTSHPTYGPILQKFMAVMPDVIPANIELTSDNKVGDDGDLSKVKFDIGSEMEKNKTLGLNSALWMGILSGNSTEPEAFFGSGKLEGISSNGTVNLNLISFGEFAQEGVACKIDRKG